MVARVTCPNCQNQFQMPIEQVIDVRADPSAKGRVLNGLLNVAACPHCGAAGPLDMPFMYHDPDKELALIYMPMMPGQDNLQRQQAIGEFTRGVMESLPSEERKAYLFQPQEFFTLENLTKKLLEVEGITPEMMEAQRAKVELLGRLAEAESEEAMQSLIEENEASIDAEFFHLLTVNLEVMQASGDKAHVQKLVALRDKLYEVSSVGQALKARSAALGTLHEDPTTDKLLDLLVEAPDAETREMLVVVGRPLLDYAFFQGLTSRIEAADGKEEKERLTAVRKEVLEVRDRLDEEASAALEERAELLRDLLVSSDPENLARRRLRELDRVFLTVLTAELEEAQATGNEDATKALQKIWELVLRLTEESLPPHVRLLNRLMSAEDEETIDKLLQANRPLVTAQFAEVVEKMVSNMEEGEEVPPEAIERMKQVLPKVKALVGEGGD
jgi:hypothetical protein